MKILHISDCHGFKHRLESGEIVSIFPEIKEEFDIVICSGDFFPNKHWGANRKKELIKEEIDYQNNWLFSNIKDFLKFIKNKPFFWSSGNHDWAEPVTILKKNGIDAYDLDNKIVEYLGITLYGFPFIPQLNNNLNFEKDSNQMRQEVEKFIKRLKDADKFNSLNILVAHCPIAGILDFSYNHGGHLGNSHMSNALFYQLIKKPELYCCGHIHEDHGLKTIDGMVVSNAATTWNIIDLTL